MTSSHKIYDTTIIGGGPVGLFAAFYAGMRDLSANIIDSLPQLGGQLAELYPEKYIYDIAGHPQIKAGELVKNLLKQVEPFAPNVQLNDTVQDITRQDDGNFRIETSTGVQYSKTVVVTAGVGAFTPRRIQVPEEAEFVGKGLHYQLTNMEICLDQDVIVVGGGDSAVDFALMIEPLARSVTLVHRRDQFRAHEESVRQLRESSIHVKTFFEVVKIHGDDRITGVTLKENREKFTIERPASLIFSALGFTAALGPIANWGLDIVNHQIVVNSKMETNIPGVFAAGDIATYPGKLKLIASGFGEAPIAISNAKLYIHPEAKIHTGHSSDRKMPELQK